MLDESRGLKATSLVGLYLYGAAVVHSLSNRLVIMQVRTESRIMYRGCESFVWEFDGPRKHNSLKPICGAVPGARAPFQLEAEVS